MPSKTPSSSSDPSNLPQDPWDPDKFEDYVKHILEKNYGYKVIKPSKNNHGYDLEIIRDGEKSIAVQVKNHKIPVNKANVKKFTHFMGLWAAECQFSEGWLISSRGFSPSAIKICREPTDSNVSLGTIHRGDIEWDHRHSPGNSSPSRTDSPPVSPSADHQGSAHQEGPRRYFGIFTNKGGTGKTTVAAHLAGAFCLMGYDVVLLDIDPQGNLIKLFQNDDEDSSLYVKSLRLGKLGRTITVLNHEKWKESKDDYNDVKIVICDCNPTFDENPIDLVKEFDYCVIPTTLNPLGIAKNSDVIKRTFNQIRDKNSKAEMFVLINYFTERESDKKTTKRNKLLLDLLSKQVFDEDKREDKKSHLIDPNKDCAIHRSDTLYYWGLHIIENKEPQLAFELYGGRNVPRDDFLKLAEYLEDHDRVSLTKR